AVLYIKKEFKLQSEPTIEGLIVAMSLVGATFITTFSGPVSDFLGRRPLLIASSVLYFLSGLVMLWSPNVYVLLAARLLDGFGIGLAVTLVPVYISETAPPEIRGLLNTLPQFTGCIGMFLSYCMVFGMSLMDSPSWRLMLGVLSAPSVVYFVFTVMFLPESPRWLVSKGRMVEAKRVLQILCGKEDVSGEMALLVEGLGVGGETSIEEYIIYPANELSNNQENVPEKDQIRLYGAEEGVSWIAKPVTDQSTLGLVSRYGSMANHSSSIVDPLVTLFGSINENVPDMGSRRSMLFPNFGSMFSMADQGKNEQRDVESLQRDNGHETPDASGAESDDNLHSPLLSRYSTNAEKEMQGNANESVSGMDIGGGWQLAYKLSEDKGEDGKKGGLQRIYLHQENSLGSRHGSLFSVAGGDVPMGGEFIHASALVNQSVINSKDLIGQLPLEAGMVRPSETAAKGPSLADLFEPGIKHALMVGIGLQILQQVRT
ncbi:trans-aconitate methyltransferase 2, partial [Sarracenia purpurea var. burkii]